MWVHCPVSRGWSLRPSNPSRTPPPSTQTLQIQDLSSKGEPTPFLEIQSHCCTVLPVVRISSRPSNENLSSYSESPLMSCSIRVTALWSGFCFQAPRLKQILSALMRNSLAHMNWALMLRASAPDNGAGGKRDLKNKRLMAWLLGKDLHVQTGRATAHA